VVELLIAVQESSCWGIFTRQASSIFAKSTQQGIQHLQDQPSPFCNESVLARENCQLILHQHSATSGRRRIHRLYFLLPSRLIRHHVIEQFIFVTLNAFRTSGFRGLIILNSSSQPTMETESVVLHMRPSQIANGRSCAWHSLCLALEWESATGYITR
jgi:hypothetical protein